MNEMKLSKKNIEKINNYFKNKPVTKAYLFGSQATEKANEDSDVDILVELDYEQRLGLLFVQMQLDLEELLNKKVDLASSNGISKYIKPIVDKEKQLIYAR
jgi:predicted nucleotidyltransferase